MEQKNIYFACTPFSINFEVLKKVGVDLLRLDLERVFLSDLIDLCLESKPPVLISTVMASNKKSFAEKNQNLFAAISAVYVHVSTRKSRFKYFR